MFHMLPQTYCHTPYTGRIASRQESLLDDARFIHSAYCANRIVHILNELVELNEVEGLTCESFLLKAGKLAELFKNIVVLHSRPC